MGNLTSVHEGMSSSSFSIHVSLWQISSSTPSYLAFPHSSSNCCFKGLQPLYRDLPTMSGSWSGLKEKKRQGRGQDWSEVMRRLQTCTTKDCYIMIIYTSLCLKWPARFINSKPAMELTCYSPTTAMEWHFTLSTHLNSSTIKVLTPLSKLVLGMRTNNYLEVYGIIF